MQDYYDITVYGAFQALNDNTPEQETLSDSGQMQQANGLTIELHQEQMHSTSPSNIAEAAPQHKGRRAASEMIKLDRASLGSWASV